jgi:energy-coupling factor transporter ATP-binding protein EcfA2
MIKPLEVLEEFLWGRPGERWNVPLLHFRSGGVFKVGDAVENILFIGSQGSGKTSSAKTLYGALLKNQFGGLVLCVKDSQIKEFLEVCQEQGRATDVIVFGAEGKHVFNPLEGASIAEGTALLMELADILNASAGSSKTENEAFWRTQSQMSLRNLLVLCQLVYGRLEIAGVDKLFRSRADTLTKLGDPGWKQSSVMAKALELAEEQAGDEGDLRMAIDYFTHEFPSLDRMQSSVAATVNGILENLRQSPLCRLFGGRSTFSMGDLLRRGRICLVGMPALGWDSKGVSAVEGKIANGVLQFCFLRAAAAETRETPAFLISDECQETVSGELRAKLSVLREYRVMPVLLTQNLAVIDAKIGKEQREAIFSNFETMVFLKQNHAETREWAAEQIGKVKQRGSNESTHWGKGPPTYGESRPLADDYRVPPIAFSKLRNGGPQNDFIVESIILKGSAVYREKWHQKSPGRNGTVAIV